MNLSTLKQHIQNYKEKFNTNKFPPFEINYDRDAIVWVNSVLTNKKRDVDENDKNVLTYLEDCGLTGPMASTVVEALKLENDIFIAVNNKNIHWTRAINRVLSKTTNPLYIAFRDSLLTSDPRLKKALQNAIVSKIGIRDFAALREAFANFNQRGKKKADDLTILLSKLEQLVKIDLLTSQGEFH